MQVKDIFSQIAEPQSYMRAGKRCYFDTYRKKLIEITPEEIIRQKTASWLEKYCSVPNNMIKIEVHMSHYIKGEPGRADIIVHDITEDGTSIYPIAIVECKNPSIPLTDKVYEQAIGYCDVVGGKYVILTNGIELIMSAYNEETDQYELLDGVLTYSQMINRNYTVNEQPTEQLNRFNIEELNDQELLAEYNEEDTWIFGLDTKPKLRTFAINMYQCLLDTEHILPAIKTNTFELIKDIGLRYMDYSNAGGGHYLGYYRSFLVRDRFNEPQIISVSLFGTDPGFRNENRNSYTSLVVAIDHFKTSHNSLQYNVDRYSKMLSDGSIEFTHNGQISSKKSSIVLDKIMDVGDRLLVEDTTIKLGRINPQKLLFIDDKEVSEFIYNLIEYALIREEVRKK